MITTAKQAYDIAIHELGEEFEIIACTELSDSWIFAFQWSDGTAIFLPPVQVKNDGTCDFWKKSQTFTDAIVGAEWLEKNGEKIPINTLR